MENTVNTTPAATEGKGISRAEKAALIGGGALVAGGALVLFQALTPVRVAPWSGALCLNEAERNLAREVKETIGAHKAESRLRRESERKTVDIKKTEEALRRAAEAQNKVVAATDARTARINRLQLTIAEKALAMEAAAAKGNPKQPAAAAAGA